MKNRPIGAIDPLLYERIKHIDRLITKVCRKYLPDPPAHLEKSVYEVFNALCKQRKNLINQI